MWFPAGLKKLWRKPPSSSQVSQDIEIADELWSQICNPFEFEENARYNKNKRAILSGVAKNADMIAASLKRETEVAKACADLRESTRKTYEAQQALRDEEAQAFLKRIADETDEVEKECVKRFEDTQSKRREMAEEARKGLENYLRLRTEARETNFKAYTKLEVADLRKCELELEGYLTKMQQDHRRRTVKFAESPEEDSDSDTILPSTNTETASESCPRRPQENDSRRIRRESSTDADVQAFFTRRPRRMESLGTVAENLLAEQSAEGSPVIEESAPHPPQGTPAAHDLQSSPSSPIPEAVLRERREGKRRNPNPTSPITSLPNSQPASPNLGTWSPSMLPIPPQEASVEAQANELKKYSALNKGERRQGISEFSSQLTAALLDSISNQNAHDVASATAGSSGRHASPDHAASLEQSPTLSFHSPRKPVELRRESAVTYISTSSRPTSSFTNTPNFEWVVPRGVASAIPRVSSPLAIRETSPTGRQDPVRSRLQQSAQQPQRNLSKDSGLDVALLHPTAQQIIWDQAQNGHTSQIPAPSSPSAPPAHLKLQIPSPVVTEVPFPSSQEATPVQDAKVNSGADPEKIEDDCCSPIGWDSDSVDPTESGYDDSDVGSEAGQSEHEPQEVSPVIPPEHLRQHIEIDGNDSENHGRWLIVYPPDWFCQTLYERWLASKKRRTLAGTPCFTFDDALAALQENGKRSARGRTNLHHETVATLDKILEKRISDAQAFYQQERANFEEMRDAIGDQFTAHLELAISRAQEIQTRPIQATKRFAQANRNADHELIAKMKRATDLENAEVKRIIASAVRRMKYFKNDLLDKYYLGTNGAAEVVREPRTVESTSRPKSGDLRPIQEEKDHILEVREAQPDPRVEDGSIHTGYLDSLAQRIPRQPSYEMVGASHPAPGMVPTIWVLEAKTTPFQRYRLRRKARKLFAKIEATEERKAETRGKLLLSDQEGRAATLDMAESRMRLDYEELIMDCTRSALLAEAHRNDLYKSQLALMGRNSVRCKDELERAFIALERDVVEDGVKRDSYLTAMVVDLVEGVEKEIEEGYRGRIREGRRFSKWALKQLEDTFGVESSDDDDDE